MAQETKLPFVDALRGYAITMVIASHAFPVIHELPWPVKRFTNLGFFGVQLFFVVSCLTLTRSWRQGEAAAHPGVRGFMVRRLFRIAPAYYLAAAFYLWLLPAGQPGLGRIATFVTFANGWSPSQMPTTAGAWIGVPGGWSVEAEFSFYALFPALMLVPRGLWPAVAGLVLSLPLAYVANRLGWAAYLPANGAVPTDQFLYYWLPNELCVFLSGLVAFELLARLSPAGRWQSAGAWLAGRAGLLLAGSAALLLLLGVVAWPRLPQPGWLFVPSPLIAALAFSGCTLALALRPAPLIVNRAVVRMGQASFSAYLVHFAVLDALVHLLPPAMLAATGMAAVAAATALFAGVMVVTGAVSQLTYRMVERPGMQLGHRINRWLDGERWASAAARPGRTVG